MPKVLVLGKGAREHAIATAISREKIQVIVAPGNAGTAAIAQNIACAIDDPASVVALAQKEKVDLVVVGPELPLVRGVADALGAAGIATFGPSKAAAQLEGSKVFMKEMASRCGVPTAAFRVFSDADDASAYVRSAGRALVVKADGLAAGKGVVVASGVDEALTAIDHTMRARAFGASGDRIVIEELLAGEEASFHVVCDGERASILVSAQDHKRVGDGDRGPNTGGMGAYGPAPIVTSEVQGKVMDRIVMPTLAGMKREGVPFRGVLFVGLMIDRGEPSLLEYNVRFGDPEACVLFSLYGGNVFELLDGAARGRVPDAPHPSGASLCVVMAAENYPGDPTTGDVIEGLDRPLAANQFVFHAGTKVQNGNVVTDGGRILTVGATGATLADAHRDAYAAVSKITFRGEHHRSDIGFRALPA